MPHKHFLPNDDPSQQKENKVDQQNLQHLILSHIMFGGKFINYFIEPN
jgi:hypothetical protein